MYQPTDSEEELLNGSIDLESDDIVVKNYDKPKL